MKILIAPDKFKGSLSAAEVCQAIKKGLHNAGKPFKVIPHPIADGGDGSLAVLRNYLTFQQQKVSTLDPIGRAIQAIYYTSETAAFIEVASASGLVLLEKKERNPLKTSTQGTGLLIADAISKGYSKIYLFLGGSATNDAGIGIAAALGFEFLDDRENQLAPIGENLPLIHTIRNTQKDPLPPLSISLLCDVNNPLYGPNGAAYVYAHQKGASVAQIEYLDRGLRHFSNVLEQHRSISVHHLSGSGAAGGIGASLIGLLGATLEKGFETIAKITGLEQQIAAVDWVISGEGKLDKQSLEGKVIDGVAQLCQKHQKPLALFVGKNELDRHDLSRLGSRYVFSVTEYAEDIQDAMQNGEKYLEKMATQFVGKWSKK